MQAHDVCLMIVQYMSTTHTKYRFHPISAVDFAIRRRTCGSSTAGTKVVTRHMDTEEKAQKLILARQLKPQVSRHLEWQLLLHLPGQHQMVLGLAPETLKASLPDQQVLAQVLVLTDSGLLQQLLCQLQGQVWGLWQEQSLGRLDQGQMRRALEQGQMQKDPGQEQVLGNYLKRQYTNIKAAHSQLQTRLRLPTWL